MDDALNMLSPLGDVYENFLKGEISFWEARIIDDDGPGYLNCFDENGNVYDYRKSGWFLGRNIYTFSKLINSFGFNQRWFAIVEHGIRAIPFFERSDGWLKNTTDRMGNELIEESYPFATMFLVQGLAEYQKIFLNNPVLLSRKWEGCDNYLEEKKQKLFSLSPIVNGMHDLSVSFMRLMIRDWLTDCWIKMFA